jgi:hypothetical protein
MTEQCLQGIIDAADPDDADDVAIRRLLVTALSNSGIELAEMMNDRIPPLPALCKLRAVRREVCPLSGARPSSLARPLISCTAKRSLLAPSQGTARVQRSNGKPRRAPVRGYGRRQQTRPTFPFRRL